MADPSFGDLVTRWQVDVAALVVVVTAGGAYWRGVARRATSWPASRMSAWFGGLAVAIVATQSGIGRFEATRFTVHMAQHVLLGMVVPLLLVLGAPITLALQSGGPATRQWLRRVLHSTAGRWLAHPVVGWSLFGGGLVVLYLTPLLDVAARNDLAHAAVHAHVVLSGALFLLPLVGADTLPRRLPFGARLLAILVAVPFHAFLGLVLSSASSPVAPDAYPSLSDQRDAAALLWGTGELLTLTVAAIVFRSWLAADRREAARRT